MDKINLIELVEMDLTNIEDQIFLYDIIKLRWSNPDIINIKYKTPKDIPTFEEHVKYITSGKFKKIYKINFKDITIGSIYIDINNFNGTFILPKLFLKAVRKYREHFSKMEKCQVSNDVHKQLYALHPDVEHHYAAVNPNNKLSRNALEMIPYELVEVIYVAKTKNGRLI